MSKTISIKIQSTVKNADSVTFGSGEGLTGRPNYIKSGPSNQRNPDSEQKVAIFHDTLRIITADPVRVFEMMVGLTL